MNCSACNSANVVKNGSIHNGKDKYLCKDCGRQFVEDPQNKIISEEIRDCIDGLLLERISLAGIARATGVSDRWLQYYVNQKLGNVPRKIKVMDKEKVRL